LTDTDDSSVVLELQHGIVNSCFFKRMNTSPNRFAFEAIAFQGTAFFDAVTKAVVDLRQAMKAHGSQEASQEPEAHELCKVIKNFTNLSLKIAEEAWADAAIMCPRVRNGHIFDHVLGIHDAASGDYEMNWDLEKALKKYKDGFAKGSVDMRANRVDGFFAEIPYVLHLSRRVILGETFDDRELAAAILHEVGHAFTQCEFVNRSVATNQVLASIAQARQSKEPAKLDAILLKVENEQHLTQKQKSALEACKKDEDYVIVAYAISEEKCRRELGFSVYESTSCEQLADQYAARCGAGRYVVTGLDKLHRLYGNYESSSHAAAMTRQTFGLVLISMTFTLWLAPLGAIIFTAATLIASISLAFLVGLGAAASLKYEMYDNPSDRFARIRAQLVEQLKNEHLNKKLLKQVLDDVEEIDVVLKAIDGQGNWREKALGHYVALFFSMGYRTQLDMEALQKQLEALASNELFVQAAKLKTV
jgi:hypothetical protein